MEATFSPATALIAPTGWWEPGPTLSPAILPNDVVLFDRKTLSGVGRVKPTLNILAKSVQ